MYVLNKMCMSVYCKPLRDGRRALTQGYVWPSGCVPTQMLHVRPSLPWDKTPWLRSSPSSWSSHLLPCDWIIDLSWAAWSLLALVTLSSDTSSVFAMATAVAHPNYYATSLFFNCHFMAGEESWWFWLRSTDFHTYTPRQIQKMHNLFIYICILITVQMFHNEDTMKAFTNFYFIMQPCVV